MTENDLREQLVNLSACTLPTVDRPTRLAEFDQFFADCVRATTRPTPARSAVRLPIRPPPRRCRVAGARVAKLGEIDAKPAELTAVRDTLRAAPAAGSSHQGRVEQHTDRFP
ncbi:hypothetical protein [Nocardia sp. alder85J]|uniref:hypothetical protein n=1 Tax=Nocardia sp. alder85J TaxID=2862949 RepID=UPI001CD6D2E4|nr:hypothetical protein [Nocardia sp. alder85J]MCX4096686.1 hypothetical protein [Nocardia sp. alder85J]